MGQKKYAIGVDYGSLSARAVLVDLELGKEIDDHVMEYPHAVMVDELPTGEKLGKDWALQHPQDYLDAFIETVGTLVTRNKIQKGEVVGIGTDFTASTDLPVTKEGVPLCFLEKYKNRPHAYVKLWKHHAAQKWADLLNEKAQERGETWLPRYGGKISSEWEVPKLWEILEEDEEIYHEMEYFVEAADWIVWQLTGVKTRNSCTAGYKGIWHKQEGYPSQEFFKSLNPQLEDATYKLGLDISPLGALAGYLTKEYSEKTGLEEGIPVAVGNVDAHVCVPAVGITETGKMLGIIGTSTCHIVLGEEEKLVEGMCGVVEDGVLPGLQGYEAGQSCVGDGFQWFVNNLVPQHYYDEAKRQGEDIQEYLTFLSEKLEPGESGLLAIDWFNGNRSTLVDVDLTGMILGLTIHSKAEEVYRALLEATAFGTKVIVDAFVEQGVAVNEFYASGGIPKKNHLMMQIYADVLNMPIYIAKSAHGPALGSAIFGAVAAGYSDLETLAKKIGKVEEKVYYPQEDNVEKYKILYREYKRLYDYFGKEVNTMKTLKNLAGR